MASKNSPSLRFSDIIEVKTFEAEPRRKRRPVSTAMPRITAHFEAEQVTEAMLKDAAKLFSENYGIWGENGFGKLGSRVRMNADRLRAQCLPDGSDSTYVSVTIDGVLAGNAFACRWQYAGRQICWITQLVVHSDYREQRLATTLLTTLVGPDDDIVGIMSSHPAACKALARAIGRYYLSEISMDFARNHAANALKASPIDYVREAKLCGSLYHAEDTTGMVSGVDSSFYVDHEEPLQALAWLQEQESWPLGELPDGHEFLLLVQTPGLRRSRSASSHGSKQDKTKD